MVRALRSLLVLAVIVPGGVARAQEADPALYQATAIVTGTDMRQRPLGFAECLTETLVKVSGAPRLQDDPAVAALAKHADVLVASFGYVDPRAGRVPHDDQGTYDRSYELTVHFDPARIDSALTSLGAPPWRGPRPLLEPTILVRPTNVDPYYLSAETTRGIDMREAIVQSASRFGLGVHFPTQAELDAWGVIPFGFPAPLRHADATTIQVIGSLAWDIHVGGWIGLWHVRQHGIDHDWRIAGGGFDQALLDMVRGAVMLAHGTGSP